MTIHPFSLFFFCFPLIEPTQSFCPSFAKGPINCNSPFTCLLTVFSLRQTKKEDKLSGAESGKKKSPCSLHLPALDTAVSRKTKGESLQGYRQTGAAWDEITQRRAEDETLLVTPLSLLDSVKREQSAYQIVLRFHLFSKDFFFFSLFHISVIHASLEDKKKYVKNKSMLRWGELCYRMSRGCKTLSLIPDSGASKHGEVGED